MDKLTTIIETDRLILRQFVEEDYQAVYDFGSNAEVQKYTGEPDLASPAAAKELIRTGIHADYEKYGYGRWATIYKPDNQVIGFAGLKYLSDINEVDIGFRFMPQYWNKGIGTEASVAIIKYGFDQLKLTRIIGIAMKENIGSQRVLEKCGMHHYKTGEYDGDGGDHLWYEIHLPKPSN